MALGIHGVFGSKLWYRSAPLIFAVLQTEGMQWQDFFWVLGVIGVVGAVLIYLLRKYLTIADSKSKLTGQKEITDASCIEEPDRD